MAFENGKYYDKLPHCFWMETEEGEDFQTVLSFTKVRGMVDCYRFEAYKPSGERTGTLTGGGIIYPSWKKISKKEFNELKTRYQNK